MQNAGNRADSGDFNPRSRKGSDRGQKPTRFSSSYFNPRSRKGSDKLREEIAQHSDNFNPRSRKGSDYMETEGLDQLLDFNPRSRKGSDGVVDGRNSKTDGISIHAPARGATPETPGRAAQGRDFNPRSRKGSDSYSGSTAFSLSKFQSTLPQGERHTLMEQFGISVDISIHAPARGATVWTAVILQQIMISIHAPARGATLALASL